MFYLIFLFLFYKATSNFTISYEPQDKKVAIEILKFAEKELPRISKDLGGITQQINIYLASSESEIEKIGGFPDWGIGCVIPRTQTIILKSPKLMKYPLDLQTLVAHEITHIVLGNLCQGIEIPRWFDEGIAMYEAREWKIGESVWLSWANFTNSILPLYSIKQKFPEEHKKAKLAYVESFSTICFIIDGYGRKSLKEIIESCEQANSFEKALEMVLGLNYKDFEYEWERWVEKRYTHFPLLINVFLPGGLLLVVFFIALFLKRKKKYEYKERDATPVPCPAVSGSRLGGDIRDCNPT